jgi:hypothetical protein
MVIADRALYGRNFLLDKSGLICDERRNLGSVRVLAFYKTRLAIAEQPLFVAFLSMISLLLVAILSLISPLLPVCSGAVIRAITQ